MIGKIEDKLLALESCYEKAKNSLSKEDMELAESYFNKITNGIRNIKEDNLSDPDFKDSEITAIKIFMNKIYDIIKKGD